MGPHCQREWDSVVGHVSHSFFRFLWPVGVPVVFDNCHLKFLTKTLYCPRVLFLSRRQCLGQRCEMHFWKLWRLAIGVGDRKESESGLGWGLCSLISTLRSFLVIPFLTSSLFWQQSVSQEALRGCGIISIIIIVNVFLSLLLVVLYHLCYLFIYHCYSY